MAEDQTTKLIARVVECLREWTTQEGWTDASAAYQADLSGELADELEALLVRPPAEEERDPFRGELSIYRNDEWIINAPFVEPVLVAIQDVVGVDLSENRDEESAPAQKHDVSSQRRGDSSQAHDGMAEEQNYPKPS